MVQHAAALALDSASKKRWTTGGALAYLHCTAGALLQ